MITKVDNVILTPKITKALHEIQENMSVSFCSTLDEITGVLIDKRDELRSLGGDKILDLLSNIRYLSNFITDIIPTEADKKDANNGKGGDKWDSHILLTQILKMHFMLQKKSIL